MSHQVDHMSAVAAKGPDFFALDAQGTTAWLGKGGWSCQAVGYRPLECLTGGGVLGLGFAWTLENLVVSLSSEEGKGQKIKQVKLISG